MIYKSTEDGIIDFRNLRSVRQIAEEGKAISLGTLERWMFHRHRNGLVRAVVEIDANTYINIPSFNDWLYVGKPSVGDFRNLMRVQQLLIRSALRESKLRHWLKHRQDNGLDSAVIVKRHREQGMILIDTVLLNQWLTQQNRNEEFLPTALLA